MSPKSKLGSDNDKKWTFERFCILFSVPVVMMVVAEYNQETAVQMQVFFCLLSTELGTTCNDIASKFRNPNSMALVCFIIQLYTPMT